jgi:acetylornithine/succinyldiaminopimelate/putrescine aminotransferase
LAKVALSLLSYAMMPGRPQLKWLFTVKIKTAVILFLALAILLPISSYATSARCVSLTSKIKATSLFHAAISAQTEGSLVYVLGHVRRALAKIAGVEESRLLEAEVMEKLLGELLVALGTAEYEKAAGSQILAARSALGVSKMQTSAKVNDKLDFLRGFGFKFLPENDKAFRDLQYLADYAKLSRDVGDGYVDDSPVEVEKKFQEAWQKIAPPNVEVIHFTATGTDANNSLYELARLNHLNQNRKIEDVELLYLRGIWGGTYGRILQAHSTYSYEHQSRPEYELPSPHTAQWQPTDPSEVTRLLEIENQTLKLLEQDVKESKVPIGGLIFEPILGAQGVYFFRNEFLLRLRNLCDQLHVPIIADEILTGGGRTGKFFAYQHYEGFEPDYVTFGKGLLVSGVAKVKRDPGTRPWLRGQYRFGTTIKYFLEPILKSTQILKRIHDDNLMKDAEEVGAYFVEKLKMHRPEFRPGYMSPAQYAFSEPRGMGLLINKGDTNIDLFGANKGRLMPYFTITKEEIDELFER